MVTTDDQTTVGGNGLPGGVDEGPSSVSTSARPVASRTFTMVLAEHLGRAEQRLVDALSTPPPGA